MSKPALVAEIDDKRAKIFADQKERNRRTAAWCNVQRQTKLLKLREDLERAKES